MSQKPDEALDLKAISADDALLDALGRGDPAPDGDGLAGLLAVWRQDLNDDTDFDVAALLAADLAATAEPAPPAAAGAVAAGRAVGDVPARDAAPTSPASTDSDSSTDSASSTGGGSVSVRPVPSPDQGRTGRRWRPSRAAGRYLTGVAAAAVLVAGLAVGAGRAEPDSPLWPVAQVLYPERSDLRLAEHTIGQAREAAAAGRYADARRTLDRATGDVGRVDDPKLASRLRAQIEEIRRTLPPSERAEETGRATPSPSAPASSPAADPTAPPAGGQTGGPVVPGVPGVPTPPGGGGTNPEQPGGIIPNIPGLPTPTLPIPIPSIPIPQLPLG